MLSSISPLGERARASRWWLTTTAYVVSSLVGGLALGLVAALLGALVPGAWRWSPAAYLLVAAAPGRRPAARPGRRPAGSCRLAPPGRRGWIGRYRGWVVGVGFGAQLGFGLVTIITSSTTYAVACSARCPGARAVGAAGRRRLRAGAGPAVGAHGAGRHPRAAVAAAGPGRARRAQLPTSSARLALAAAAAALTVSAVRGIEMRTDRLRHLRRGAGGVVGGRRAPPGPAPTRPPGSTAVTRSRPRRPPPTRATCSPSAPCRWCTCRAGRCPPAVGDFGSGAVEVLGPEDVFVALVEYGSDLADTGLFCAAGRAAPGAVAVRHQPAAARDRRGAAPASTSSASGGRAFCLFTVLGSHAAGWRPCPAPPRSCASLQIVPAATMRAQGVGV